MLKYRDQSRIPVQGKSLKVRFLLGFGFAGVFLMAVHLLAQEPALNVRLRLLTYGYSGELPFVNPQGVFYDRRFKEIYICDTGNHQVVICDSTGFPVYRFKHWVDREGRRFLGEPRSLAVNSEGDIFLTDNLADYVDVLDHRGQDQYQIRLAPLLGLSSAKPVCLALDAEDVLYVGFRAQKSELVALDPDGKVLRRFENQAENHQDFGEIVGLWVDSLIYVVDATGEPSVRTFSKNGAYQTGFGKHDIGWDGFSLPSGVAVTSDGVIWIVDTFRQVIKAFTPQGNFIQYIGGYGREPGAMRYPVSVTGDGESTVLVLESTGARIQGFEVKKEGIKIDP